MDIIAFRLYRDHSVAVPQECVAFVRGGTAAWQTRTGDVLLDPNHALLLPLGGEPAALTARGGAASLTLLCEPHFDYGAAPSARDRLAQLVLNLRTSSREKPVTLSAQSPGYGRVVQQCLNATLERPFRLDDVAKAVKLSPFTASRVFRRESGLPPRIYNRRLRLRTALARIADRHALSHVALELGFFDRAHFTKAFRAEFGFTPSEWRKYVIAAFNAAA